jgi:hypothetical protein
LEIFYRTIIDGEKNKNTALKSLEKNYQGEVDKIRNRFFPRRILQTILTEETNLNHLLDVPYLGKD